MYHPDRNYGCRLTTDGVLKGMRTVVMENQKLRITVLVDKGTDIWEFLYKPLDMDFMWRSPMGLRNPSTFVSSTGSSSSFSPGVWFDYWEGAWQEVLPNGGVSSSYKGAEYGLHGESSLIPWEFRVLEDRPERVSVAFWVRMYRSPFYLEKILSLEENSGVLSIQETLINEGKEPMDLMWGHHPTFSEAFLGEDCVIDTGARKVHNMPGEIFFESQRFDPGVEFDWPQGKARSGEMVDVSLFPRREAHLADMLYLSDFESGWVTITNQRLGVGFGMAWPKDVFPYMWWFQNCMGWYEHPLYGRSCTMALEPFTSKPSSGLQGALEDGTALHMEAGEEINVELIAVGYQGEGRVERLKADGTVKWKK